ncbi:MAG: heparinase II/III family protein [Bacteroidales bacterium]|nr:heparinase II/III family protein [Bacteroidales bacterium]
MKKLLLSIIALVLVGTTYAQKQFVSTDTKLPAHPRILMLKGEEKALMKKIKKDVYWNEIHTNLVAECDKMIDLPVSQRIKEGKRLLSVSREALRRIFDLSYAYRTTGQKKYAARAIKEMMACAAFTDWNPSHFLDVGEMTMALSIGYDWCFKQLSADEEAQIRTAIIEKGMKASLLKEEAWYLTAEHNWNQVCNAGITFGSLAVFDSCKEFAVDRINTAFNSIPKAMGEYAPDGAYPEGPGYWGYGTSFNALFISVVEKALGSDFGLTEKPGFLSTGMYSQVQITPAGYNFNYSDNGAGAGFNTTVFWFYSRVKDPALLYMQKMLYERGNKLGLMRNRLLPMALIYGAGSGASLANPEKPSSLMWTGRGHSPIAIMRSSWTEGSAYLGFKLGSPAVNHAHMDVGSFIFEAEGIRWAYDFGGESYGSLEGKGVDLWNRAPGSQRWDVYKYRTTSHNTLSFNDKPMSVVESATLDDSGDKNGVMYAMSDLSAMFKDQIPGVKRAVSMVDKKYAVIQDQFTTNGQFTKVRWNMLTAADKVTFVNETTALLEKDGKKLYLRVEAPFPVRLYNELAVPTNTYDSPLHGERFVGFEADLALNTTQQIAVYLMPGEQINNAKAPYEF